jgi:ABC-type transport system involved in multi-copper enzyme maturation permease subunit
VSDAARPSTPRAPRIDPFEAVYQAAQLAVKRAFKGARAWVCLVIVLLPAAVSFLVRSHGTSPKNQEEYFYGMLGVYHFAIAAPVTALLFASSFPWPEAEEGTLTYWFTSPVRRWTVLAGRYVAALLVGALLLCVDVLAIGLPLQTAPEAQLASVMGAAVASTLLVLPAYLAIFQLASTVTRFCLIIGVVYVLIENVVSIANVAFVRATMVFYVRSQLYPSIPEKSRDAAEVFHVIEPASAWTSLATFAGVTVVALGLSLFLVESIEYRGRNAQQG